MCECIDLGCRSGLDTQPNALRAAASLEVDGALESDHDLSGAGREPMLEYREKGTIAAQAKRHPGTDSWRDNGVRMIG